jgi:hypothetical protein
VKRTILLLLPGLLLAGVDLTASSYQSVVLSLALPAPVISLTAANGASYSVLSLPEAGASDGIGTPQLPVIRKLVEIPYGAEVSVQVTDLHTELATVSPALQPVQPPIPKSGPAPAFAYDAKSYERNEYAPADWARVASVAEVRNHRIALVEINPVRYNPVSAGIEYLTSARVELRLLGGNPAETRRHYLDFYSQPFEDMLRGLVVNYGSFVTDPPPTLPVGYLIIVPDAWYGTVQPLAQWRRQKGMEVTVAKLSEVGGGSNSQVLAYIQNAYDNWPVKPSYVLLIGDVDAIGYFNGQGEGNPDTDLNYSMLAGSDYLPDICVSRASVTSVAELDSLVQKTVKYEKNQWLNGTDWARKAFFIASADGGNHGVAERTHRYCMDKIRPLGVVCDSQYLYYQNARQTTVDKLNEGRAWCIYSGHGGETEWAEHSPNFDVTATHALTNTDKVPFVATFACLTGAYAGNPECFSESWIRTGYRGAISHMASTVTSYWTEDDTFQRRLFDCLYDSSYTWVMSAINRAKIWYFAEMGNTSTTRRYFEMYNLMGDGGVDVYNDVPHALSVAHPAVIPLGAYVLHVTVEHSGTPVRNALVCAAGKADTTVHSYYGTDNSGVVDLPVTTTAPDSIFLTVTGHNLAPYLGTVLALPSSGPYVMRLKSIIDDAAPGGNADGIINPGETVNLPTWVKNWGQGEGSGITATLRSNDPSVSVTDSFKNFGNIAAGDSAYTGPDGFEFLVGDTCSNGHSISFTLVCRDSRDTTWSSSFSLLVGTGIMAYADKRVYDPPPGGNSNGRVDADETAQLFVSLRNTGLGHGYNVSAKLRSGDSRFQVTDSIAVFGAVLRDSTVENTADPFTVHADAGILPETSIPCTLLVAADGNYSTRLTFSLIIGEIRTFDPIPDNFSPPHYWAYDDVDSGYVEHPSFNWIELRGRGTRLTLSDDQTVTISLPSGFGPVKYYGQRYTQLSICGNGFVMPGSFTESPWTNDALPTTSLAAPAICLNWDDLYPPVGGGVLWFHDTLNHALVVEYDSVAYYSPQTTTDKFEVVFYDTTLAAADGSNEMVVQYLTANNYTSSTSGIQDDSQTHGINCQFNGAYTRGVATLRPGSAIKYTTDLPTTGIAAPEDNRVSVALPFAVSPNPFRGTTRVRWQVRTTGKVNVAVFDVAGRAVNTLCNSRLNPGSYTATWNGCDDNGRALAAGIYFLSLETENSRLSRKLLLTR